jgi:hypothetical protein
VGLFRRKRNPPIATEGAEPSGRSFGFKSAWLAVRAGDNREVADALGLEGVGASAWAAGVAAVHAADVGARPAPVFVSSPVDGWVLVPFSLSLADTGEFDLAALSGRFGEVQRFVTHRVVDLHEWERWVDGKPVRRYSWLGESGELQFSDGDPSELEEDLLPDGDADWEDWEIADEERVIELAGAWSVDPTRLDERTDIVDSGLLGRR